MVDAETLRKQYVTFPNEVYIQHFAAGGGGKKTLLITNRKIILAGDVKGDKLDTLETIMLETVNNARFVVRLEPPEGKKDEKWNKFVVQISHAPVAENAKNLLEIPFPDQNVLPNVVGCIRNLKYNRIQQGQDLLGQLYTETGRYARDIYKTHSPVGREEGKTFLLSDRHVFVIGGITNGKHDIIAVIPVEGITTAKDVSGDDKHEVEIHSNKPHVRIATAKKFGVQGIIAVINQAKQQFED